VIGLGIYAFAGRHTEPVPPITAPEPAPATPSAAEPAPAPPPALEAVEPSPAEVEAALGLSRGDWQAAQLGLKSQGFDAGAADGVVGPKTRQAVAAWQARVGADATGYLAAGQLDRIGRSSRTAGQVFTDTLNDGSPCPFCPEMVVVPAGSFAMGSASGEEGRDKDEGPQREVTFAQPFAIGRYEVTFDQWDACVAAGRCNGYRPDDEGWGRGSRPVINVSWHDVQDFVSWLSEETGQSYRLPTEAEWEYAARGGTTRPFWTGGTISTAQANYDGNYTYGAGVTGVYRQRTVVADDPTCPANPFGLLHVHGNVWEWVQDCYADSYDGAPSDGHTAVARNGCTERVLRGGSWYFIPRNLRSANPNWNAPETRNNNTGFGVASTLPCPSARAHGPAGARVSVQGRP
jgi:formylglycine-generating enzyme required for sulfatase activity